MSRRRIGFGENGEEVSIGGVGDKHLRAVDNVAAVFTFGFGFDADHVRTGGGFGDTIGDEFAFINNAFTKPVLLLLFGSRQQNRQRAEAVGADAGADTAASIGQFFGNQRFFEDRRAAA